MNNTKSAKGFSSEKVKYLEKLSQVKFIFLDFSGCYKMETPQHSVKPCAKSREAERKRRYREMKKSSATNEELVENRKKNAEQQQRFRESMANCSDKEKVEQHKRKRAEIQRNYKKVKKQCAGKMYIAWQ